MATAAAAEMPPAATETPAQRPSRLACMAVGRAALPSAPVTGVTTDGQATATADGSCPAAPATCVGVGVPAGPLLAALGMLAVAAAAGGVAVAARQRRTPRRVPAHWQPLAAGPLVGPVAAWVPRPTAWQTQRLSAAAAAVPVRRLSSLPPSPSPSPPSAPAQFADAAPPTAGATPPVTPQDVHRAAESVTSATSALDRLYRRLIRNNFFHAGFGDFTHLERIVSLRANAYANVAPDHPVQVERVERVAGGGYAIVHGSLHSPLDLHSPGLLPPEAATARFQLILPTEAAFAQFGDPAAAASSAEAASARAPATTPLPVCVQFAATGDHSFWRRRVLAARPLLRRHGIASLLLENPLYGRRKPEDQVRSNLRHVFDLYLMGVAIQYEAVALLHWLTRCGFGPLGLAGTQGRPRLGGVGASARAHQCPFPVRGKVITPGGSMGGHMAFQAAAAWPHRLALVSFVGPFSPASVFTQGVLAAACNWQILREQLAKRFPDETPPVQVRPPLLPAHVVGEPWRDASPRCLAPSGAAASTRQEYVHQLMDEVASLHPYRGHIDTSAAIVYAARRDAYVPLADVETFKRNWPGVEIRYLDAGHVMSLLFHMDHYCRGIADAFALLRAAPAADAAVAAAHTSERAGARPAL